MMSMVEAAPKVLLMSVLLQAHDLLDSVRWQ